MARSLLSAFTTALLLLTLDARGADPPVPSGPHPRLFMTAANLDGFKKNAGVSDTAATSLVTRCQETIDHPEWYRERGGADGDNWPGAALACAFAYKAKGNAEYLTQALLYWKTALSDDQKLGDALGCTPQNATFDWQKQWNGDYPPPAVLVTSAHDTGYPMRWFGPSVSLVYDWLYDASGVDDALRGQTRTCLTAWVDNYTLRGYLNKEPGHNYHAGYAVAKTLASIAIGTDGGADGHLWTETLHDLFATQLVKGALAAQSSKTAPPGLMVGGDWGSWQYGPLSVAEYAVMTRAVEEQGAPQPEMDVWLNSLAVRYAHGVLPRLDGQFFGNGDFDSDASYQSLNAVQADAVLLGPSSDQAAGVALFLKQQKGVGSGGYFWDALGELRQVTPVDYRAATPPEPLSYVARGLGNMYVRTDWTESAFWGVFMSGTPDGDHGHLAASNFVFSRGGDHLIVDSSNYGDYATFETNAISADASVTPGDYAKTQTPWAIANLPWSRATSDAVFAARAEFAHAFDFNGTPSDIPYAQREWVLLPEGELVTIDRVHTSAATRNMYLNFHANTKGSLTIDATGVAVGTVGSSALAIHPVLTSGATPTIVKPPVGACPESDKGLCSYPCGACTAARFAVDEYSLTVPGAWAVAIHVIDGLAAAEKPAEVGSLNDDNFDPPPKKNGDVIGAAVYRGTKQTYVIASSAQDGRAGATLTYGVPGASPARHIVYDAPEAADATSSVVASASADRCVITIQAGSGGGIEGRPLMFQVASAADGCTMKADTAVAPATPPPGGGITAGTGSPDGGGAQASSESEAGGCACTVGRRTEKPIFGFALAAGALLAYRRRFRRPSRALVACAAIWGCSSGNDTADTQPSAADAATGGAGSTGSGGSLGGTGGGLEGAGGGTSGDAAASTGLVEPFYTTPYVQIMTPMPQATYFAPATIRIWGHAPVPDGYAARLDFYLGATLVGTAARTDRVDYYEVTVANVAAGSYEIHAQNENGLESVHVPITVVEVPAHQGPTQDLTSDIVLSGTDDLEILGTATARALLTSKNGSHIRSASGWTGHLIIRNTDVIGLGKMDDPCIDVSAQAASTIEISDSVFDRTGPLALQADDQAPIILRGNTFQPNLLTPVNDEADYAGSHPSITIGGNSSARKYFQGNNVGVSFVRFSSSHWQVGGTKDADGNILLGVRAGMEFADSGDNTLQGNFSFHRYPYGWSQGHNLDFEGSSTGTSLVEHNIFRGSSWMIQSMNGDFRYNLLVDNINEAFFRYTEKGTTIHHNVLVNVGYQRMYSPSGGLYFLGDTNGVYNNTVDVGGKRLGWVNSTMIRPSGGGRAHSNVFVGFAYETPNAVFAGPDADNPKDWAEADYNCFFNPDTQDLTRYETAGFGAHDCGGGSGSADPKFAKARIIPFPFGDGDVWQRRVTVSQILSFYRAMYTPALGSPLIDQGDPADDTGGARNTDIGAVGAGNPHPDDLFGTFGK